MEKMGGAFWKVFSMACFAGINGIVRYASGGAGVHDGPDLPINVIMFFQNVFGTLILLPLTFSQMGSLKTAFPVMHLGRIATAVAGVYLWYLTLSVMPIAEGVALSFTSPIFTVIGARLLLDERFNPQRIAAIVFCILGSFLITRPDIALMGGDHSIGLYAVFPILSAVLFALTTIATRKLAIAGESASTLATYLLLFMTPASFVLALLDWQTPNLTEMGWLVLLGLLAALAHFSFARAFQLAEVTFLTPFAFSKFFISALIGYLAFSEFSVSVGLWFGSLLIAVSILLITIELPSKRRSPREA